MTLSKTILFIDEPLIVPYFKESIIYLRNQFPEYEFWALVKSEVTKNILHFFDGWCADSSELKNNNVDYICVFYLESIKNRLQKTVDYEKIIFINKTLRYSVLDKKYFINNLAVEENKTIFPEERCRELIIDNINKNEYEFALKLSEFLDSKPIQMYYKGICYLKLKNFFEAENYLQKVISKYEKNIHSFYISAAYNLFNIYQLKNEKEDAGKMKSLCLKYEPGHSIKMNK